MRKAFLVLAAGLLLAAAQRPSWRHLSTKTGDLEPPNTGGQQTSATVFDIDKDGINDFVITERTAAPSVVWYRRNPQGWKRYVLESASLHIEAGATYFDVDGDGDLDFVAAGDYKTNEIWWWENPAPNSDPKPWKRHIIKNSGERKHHDMIFGDFDGDGKPDLVFWNQNAHTLFFSRVPANPRESGPWTLIAVYTYAIDSEPQERGNSHGFKSVNEHEGLAAADIDGDGKLDIVAGGRWFKYIGNDRFRENLIDPAYTFTRAAAGQIKEGGRPEVVLVAGDGAGPLMWYEWVKGAWIGHEVAQLNSGHSLALLDVDGDGHLDIFCAEMRLNGGNPDSKIYIFYGDGKGNFEKTIVATGFGLHESKIADLDGDGKLDILGKPYNWETPRLDIWLQK